MEASPSTSAAAADRNEIAFFDLETTVPFRSGMRFEILEFGAILVCPRKLVELDNYSTLVCPSDLNLISEKSVRCNGISRESVSSAPPFSAIADKVFDILHGRIWAGHNILRFDCVRIREAFADIGRPPPEPKGTIDSLALLTQRFGKRAGNMKMATLATYFGLGKQTHRSLDDVRMNLEVLKYCATVLFLESSLPDILVAESTFSQYSSTRARHNGELSPVGIAKNTSSADLEMKIHAAASGADQTVGEQFFDAVQCNASAVGAEPFNLNSLAEVIERESQEVVMVENSVSESPEATSPVTANGCNSSSATFLTLDKVSVPSIAASLVPSYRGYQRIQITHKDTILKLHCNNLKVRVGLSTRFLDHAGRPRLSFVVNAPPRLSQVLEACDNHAQSLFVQSGSTSDWRPAVMRKDGFWNSPIIRLHIPTLVTGDVAKYATEIYGKDADSWAEHKILFTKFDVSELDTFLRPGTSVEAYFSLDPYDYLQNAGIRLVAEKLVILPN